MLINGISPLASVCTMVAHTHTRIIIKNQLITFSLSMTEEVSKTFLNTFSPALMKTLKI